MIVERRFKRIEGNKQISGAVYTDGEGKIIMQSRYERELNWFERLFERLILKIRKSKNKAND